ncbi:PrsW family glutamic-type intramembrane protease [Streptomyces sp. NPDC127038]|uniref:PrsW family glutamic-type intramembrane protease n=1 Tax=Streptomyces sp. NPDC127038 TaxID=3347114 RepID=UPI003661AC3C
MTQNQPPGPPRARIPGPQQPPPSYARIPAGLWKRCLGGGLALWTLSAAVTYATDDVTALPTLILLGSFLTPVAFTLWAYERHGRDLGTTLLLGCLLTGGALGALGASVTAYQLTRSSLWLYVGSALAEEAVKLGALAYLLRRHPRVRGPRAGLVLGATLGFGFAALEGAGHVFDAAVSLQGADLRTLLETEILRGALAPFGQGLWTAVAGAALLARRRPDGRFRLTARLTGAWLGVSLLHALWDSTRGIALWLVARLSRTALGAAPLAPGRAPRPAAGQDHLFTLFSVGGLLLLALAGAAWARSLAHRDPAWRNTP